MKKLRCVTTSMYYQLFERERGPPMIRDLWERNNILYHATYWQLLTKVISPTKLK